MTERTKRWLLACSSTVVALLFLELFLGFIEFRIRHGKSFYTAYQERARPFFVADPDLGYRSAANIHVHRPPLPPLPNAPRRTIFYDVDTDVHGFRFEGIFDSPKPKDEVRVFCLGGSTTFGAEVPNKFTYPEQLGTLLHDSHVKVVNAGVGGYRSIHLLKYYRKVIRPLQPDIVIIYEGWNDYEDFLYDYWKPYDPMGHCLLAELNLAMIPSALGHDLYRIYCYFRHTARVELPVSREVMAQKYMRGASDPQWVNEFLTNIQELIKDIKADGGIPVLIVNPSPEFPGAPIAAKEFAEHDLNMAGRWDSFVVALDHIRSSVRLLAKKNHIPIVDVNVPFDAQNHDFKKKFLLFVDRMHMTKEGNRLMAETILPTIRALVDSRRRGS